MAKNIDKIVEDIADAVRRAYALGRSDALADIVASATAANTGPDSPQHRDIPEEDVLRAFSSDLSGLTARQAANKLKVPTARLHDILASMASDGFLKTVARGYWTLTEHGRAYARDKYSIVVEDLRYPGPTI